MAALLLAAGEGRRMGGPKALLTLGGATFLGQLCQRFSAAGVDEVVAVLGAEAERVRREAGIPEGVTVALNERWQEGMLSSIRRGLDEAEALGCEAVLVHPVDNPLVSDATVAAVATALREGARIAVPGHGKRRGHPAGFARSTWPALHAADPARGARAVVAEHPEWVRVVPAGADCLADLDTPEDLETLRG